MSSFPSGAVAALVTFLVLDGVWLGLIARHFYKRRLGGLLKSRPNLALAGFFYVLHVIGLVVFALPQAATVTEAVLFGGLFGVCVYSAYDLTNLATIKGWPVSVSLVDLAWGTLLSSIATVAAFLAGNAPA